MGRGFCFFSLATDPLWSPVIEGATEWVDRPIKQERLDHCRLALAYGGADGLVVCGARAEVEPGSVLSLRVEKVGAEYWAFWGKVSACATGEAGLRRDPTYTSADAGHGLCAGALT